MIIRKNAALQEVGRLSADLLNEFSATLLSQEALMASRLHVLSASDDAGAIREILTEFEADMRAAVAEHDLKMKGYTIQLWAAAGLPADTIIRMLPIMAHDIIQSHSFFPHTNDARKAILELMVEEMVPGRLETIVETFRSQGLLNWRLHYNARSMSRREFFTQHTDMRTRNAQDLLPELPEDTCRSLALIPSYAGVLGVFDLMRECGFEIPALVVDMGRRLETAMIFTINEGLSNPAAAGIFPLATIEPRGFVGQGD